MPSVYTVAPGVELSRTKLCKLAASARLTATALTVSVSRSLAPAVAVLPTEPRPARCLPLRLRQVLALAAHVGLIDLDGAGEQPAGSLYRFADTVRQVPRGFLRDVQLPVQLYRRNALLAGSAQIDGERPFPQRQIRSRHYRPGADAKMLAAIPAAPRHRPTAHDRRCAGRSAMRAMHAFRPALGLEPFPRRFLVRKHVGKLHQVDTFAICLPRSAMRGQNSSSR